MHTENIEHAQTSTLSPPRAVLTALPGSNDTSSLVEQTRAALRGIIHGTDGRLAVIVGPCSIHDPEAAIEYACRLAALQPRLCDALEIVMRVYFEKPRTTIGWKGLINDPDLDGSCNIDKGLRLARSVLLRINALNVPCGCEFLDPATPPYLADLVSWSAIGARTSESQTHREIASGLPCPVGFKNATNGNVGIAVDAATAAAAPHHFVTLAADGRAAVARTPGNPDGHVILRGGAAPNYDTESVAAACAALEAANLPARVIVDASHANSRKKPEQQPQVVADIARQIESGSRDIAGVMIESHLIGGRQDIAATPLTYGQSVTDGCIDWHATAACLQQLAQAVRTRGLGAAA